MFMDEQYLETQKEYLVCSIWYVESSKDGGSPASLKIASGVNLHSDLCSLCSIKHVLI